MNELSWQASDTQLYIETFIVQNIHVVMNFPLQVYPICGNEIVMAYYRHGSVIEFLHKCKASADDKCCVIGAQ